MSIKNPAETKEENGRWPDGCGGRPSLQEYGQWPQDQARSAESGPACHVPLVPWFSELKRDLCGPVIGRQAAERHGEFPSQHRAAEDTATPAAHRKLPRKALGTQGTGEVELLLNNLLSLFSSILGSLPSLLPPAVSFSLSSSFPPFLFLSPILQAR